MANTKISNLPSITTPNVDSVVPVVQSGVTSKITYDNLKTAITSSISVPTYNQYEIGSFQTFTYVNETSTGTLEADRLIAKKIVVEEDTLVNKIRIRFFSGGAGTAVLGIYNMQDGVPSTLIAQTPVEYNTSITSVQVVTLTSDVTLNKGVYAVVYLGSISVTGYTNVASRTSPNWGYNGSILGSGNHARYEAAFTYSSTLPGIFPSGSYSISPVPQVIFTIVA